MNTDRLAPEFYEAAQPAVYESAAQPAVYQTLPLPRKPRPARPVSRSAMIAVGSVLVANLLATALLAAHLLSPTAVEPAGALEFVAVEHGAYVLYIGTNDKDTYQQIIPTAEAIDIVNGICARYVEGYTMSTAEGGWLDEAGILTQETTLVYTFVDADQGDIIRIMDDVLSALNQNSILVERRDVDSAFYYGSGPNR